MSNVPPAPFGASSASEWLSLAASRLADADPEHADLLARIALLTAALERMYHLPDRAPSGFAALAPALSRVPDQLAHLPAQHPARRWFELAALAEFHGEAQLARVTINALADTLGEHDPVRALECGFTSHERDELLALCWCRRARLSRVAGALLDAQYHFEEALALVGERPWRDARLAAELGLANLAVSRGNYPQVERRCTALLSDVQADSAMAPAHRVAAYQMRAIAHRKRGAFIEALLDSWSAYDLLGEASVHRVELVVSMAETALEAGDVGAARAAFSNARREATDTGAPLRVVAAAVTGYARALMRAPMVAADLEGAAVQPLRQLLADHASSLAPRERVYAMVTLAECRVAQGQLAEARTTLHEALPIAAAHTFNDHVFRIEALFDQLNAMQANSVAKVGLEPTTGMSAVEGEPRDAERHPALYRLTALAAVR